MSDLPEKFQAPFAELAERLRRLLPGNFIGLVAYGGWLSEDPFLNGELATSVVTLRKEELGGLTNLAGEGSAYAKKGVRAPYFMTEQYLSRSCDTFPLDLLEIQQTGVLIDGENKFKTLRFERRCVRSECERCLKTELMYLQQGLLRGDSFSTMRKIVDPCMRRLVRTLIGVLHLHKATPMNYHALSLVRMGAEVTNLNLGQLEGFIKKPPDRVGAGQYNQVYREISALAEHVDELDEDDGASVSS